jgi:BASS family bile acid:Na+ symporter
MLALIVVLLAIAPDFRAMLNLGMQPLAAILIIVALALAIGHLLGGPPREQRSVLAVASIARNIGLAFFIAGLSDYGQQFIPTLLTYMILGSLLAVPYGVWIKRQKK